MSLKSKIQALITAANAKTGETDATLTDAVQTLVDGYGGITPAGNINITDTNVTDVTNYATAQVVDADLIASNIKKDVNILGVVGTFEGGGGGSLPSSISKIDGGSFTPASNENAETYRINHSLGELPQYCIVWTEELTDGTPVDTNYAVTYGILRIGSYFTSSTAEQYAVVNIHGRSNGGGDNLSSNTGTQAQLANFASTTYFAMRKSGYYYKAGVTYKWIAWT